MLQLRDQAKKPNMEATDRMAWTLILLSGLMRARLKGSHLKENNSQSSLALEKPLA